MRSELGDAADTGAEGIRDVQLEALAHSRRRRLLEYLLEEDPNGVTLSAAVAHLAGTTDQDYRQVKRVTVHRHLPKLEDAGVVRYDPQEERLTFTGDDFVTGVLDLF